ncbi:MAG: hypothetical protein LC753_14355 [Acidobacteria bacterium]|nr:hypothetical protein [Acidobacteriota bacterium]MCA1651399.1 hypothetical protein [Acidobacteriota bacterium]
MSVQRRVTWIAIALFCGAGLAAAGVFVERSRRPEPKPRPVLPTRAERARQMLFEDIQPVKLANCELERFGEKHDGGYLLCGNLLGGVKSAYSYGISGYDQWGCDVSTRLRIRVHEYDCFDLTRPVCKTGKAVFHAECIGNSRRVEHGRPFDTLENQVRKNRDAGKRLVVKMDVEGAEWESVLGASDALLNRIDQMAVEFHGFDEWRFIVAISRLKGFFYIASLHWNNYACDGGTAPFLSWAYELLLVNKRIGVLDPVQQVVPNLLTRPNDPERPDCQVATPKP